MDHAHRSLAHGGRRHNASFVPRQTPSSALPGIPSTCRRDWSDYHAQTNRGAARVPAPAEPTRQTTQMILTLQEKAEWLDACRAMLDGEPIEFRSSLTGQWLPATHIAAGRAHRRKPAPPPAPRLVPLGPDDVLGCVLRSEFAGAGFVAITEVTKDGIVAEAKFQTFNALQYNRWEYHRLGEIEDGKPVWRRCEK